VKGAPAGRRECGRVGGKRWKGPVAIAAWNHVQDVLRGLALVVADIGAIVAVGKKWHYLFVQESGWLATGFHPSTASGVGIHVAEGGPCGVHASSGIAAFTQTSGSNVRRIQASKSRLKVEACPVNP